MKHIALYGATSAIAIEISRLLATNDYHLSLVARDKSALEVLQRDLSVRGAGKVDIMVADLAVGSAIDEVANKIETPDTAILLWGTLPNQTELNSDPNLTEATLMVNGVMPIRLAQQLANQMEQRGSGMLMAIGSPAGDRGRKANYVYGSAKAMLATTFSGLRQRLGASGVRVTLIKPGFVKTPMTEDFERDGPLWSEPEVIAQRIVKAMDQDKAVIYAPFYWRVIMLIIQHIPDFLFKKLNF